MPEHGISSRLPARYRLALALSLALFIHTLLASLLPLLTREPPESTATVRFELVPRGSQASLQRPQSQADPGSAAAGQAVSPFEVEPLTSEEQQRKASGQRETVARHSETAPAIGKTSAPASGARTLPDTESAKPGANSSPTASSRAGQQTPSVSEPTPDARVSSIDLPEKETDPYLLALIAKLAGQLDQSPLPALRQLDRPVYVTVELQLMSNGALIRAELTRQSGVDSLDQAAYRAALGASPYPEPPHSSGRQRYRVNLVFSPERL